MKNLYLILAAFTLVACQSPKEKALKEIEALEVSDSTFNMQTLGTQKDAYLDFAKKYPDDEHAPDFLFKAAQRCNALASQGDATANHKLAIALFDRIQHDYPKHKLSEESLFMSAYIYENNLGDNEKAKEAYALFIQKYPNSELSEDAKLAIENLGKSPEEIIGGSLAKDTLL